MEADDAPTRHTVADFVDLARRMAEKGTDLAAFGHYMLSACRQRRGRVSLRACAMSTTLTPWTLEMAHSAHHTFGGIFGDLGLQTKPSKAQPPAKEHKEQTIQGVYCSLTSSRRSAASPNCHGIMQESLGAGTLEPHAAQRLVGKLGCLNQAVFGAVRRHQSWWTPSCQRRCSTTYSPGSSLAAPLAPPRQVWATIFGDAFFVEDGRRIKAGHVPDCGTYRQRRLLRLRRGAALVPRRLCPAQGLHLCLGDLGPGLGHRDLLLPTWWTAYIDNVAVNGMVATVWGMAASNGWAPYFERVTSSDNFADALSRGDDAA